MSCALRVPLRQAAHSKLIRHRAPSARQIAHSPAARPSSTAEITTDALNRRAIELLAGLGAGVKVRRVGGSAQVQGSGQLAVGRGGQEPAEGRSSTTMQDQALVVPSILHHAARWHGQQTIVSQNPEGDTSVTTYGELLAASRACAALLRGQGVGCALPCSSGACVAGGPPQPAALLLPQAGGHRGHHAVEHAPAHGVLVVSARTLHASCAAAAQGRRLTGRACCSGIMGIGAVCHTLNPRQARRLCKSGSWLHAQQVPYLQAPASAAGHAGCSQTTWPGS